MHQEINRSRWAIRRAINAMQRPAKPVPKRSPLRLSLAEREEISRGSAAGESLRSVGASSGACAVDGVEGGGGERRLAELSSSQSRRCRGAADPATEDVEAGGASRASRVVEAKLEQRWSQEQSCWAPETARVRSRVCGR